MTPRRLKHVATTALAVTLFLFLLAPTGRLNCAAQQSAGAPAQSGPQAPAAAPPDSSNLVTTAVAVTDERGRFAAGLTRDAFTIEEGKSAPPVAYFSDEEVPQSVGIAFDISGSMSPLALGEARGALVRFMRQAHPSNEYFILGFDSELRHLTGWTRDDKILIEALNKLAHIKPEPGGGTRFTDACAAAVEKIAQGAQPRRVLIVISDGLDSGSKSGSDNLRELIRRSGVLVYGVGIIGDGYSESSYKYARIKLEEMAKVSGGKAYFPSNKQELDDTFQRIGYELHSQYTVGFVPENRDADGKWRRFKVKVAPTSAGKLYVRSREGYYATPPSAP